MGDLFFAVSIVDMIDWNVMSKQTGLTETFINEMRHRVNWVSIFRYQTTLSRSFIHQNIDKIYICDNVKHIIRHYWIQYSLEHKGLATDSIDIVVKYL